MPNVKTAISIEKPIFEKMDAIAKRLNIPRSRLFSQAAQEFIRKHHNAELLERINKAYDDQPESEPLITNMRSKHLAMVEDQW